ncbi:MAG TPA: xanthine dehydrogenase family protein molybdopterin-binding subunit [Chloroflexota bacterium]|nr:xanthine dehydrogenase family protein molybdopterin-binding subunit [Chloroflexota bacterium]
MTRARLIGSAVKRVEDPRLITGAGTYIGDLAPTGMVHAEFVRSQYANARLTGIDTRAALAMPGVVAVFTGADVNTKINALPGASNMEGAKNPPRTILADGIVRFMGEAIAVVVAESKEIARDAADRVVVDYEALPVIIDLDAAATDGAPLVHESLGTNICFHQRVSHGDVDAAFARADKIVERRIVNQRVAALPIECRASLAEYRRGEGSLVVYAGTQFPHVMRTQITAILGMRENQVRVIAPEVGGGFGAKANVYPEEILVPWLARQLGRPVRWLEERRENLATMAHGRDQIDYISAACAKDGTVLGLKGRLLADLGAYLYFGTAEIPTLTTLMGTGPYLFKDLRYDLYGVFTNKVPTDAFRGAGRPEATYFQERMMDAIADELGLDPAEVRKRNFIKKDQFPYTTPIGLTYDSGDYARALDTALEVSGFKQLKAESVELRKQGKLRGVGFASYVEICAFGPSKIMGAGGFETAIARVEPSGKVTIYTGASAHGQGHETSFAQIAADTLEIDINDVTLLHGDTASAPYSNNGTGGSRSMALGGSSVKLAMEDIREKTLKIAAHMLEVSFDDVEMFEGTIQVKGAPGKSITFAAVAREAYNGVKLPDGMEPGLQFTRVFDPPNFTFPFGTHVAVVDVDMDTGKVKLVKYLSVDDCGNVVNPMLVDGQVQGGVAQGAAQALWEEIVYDNDTGQLVTGSLGDYAAVRADMLPMMENHRTVTITPSNPLGVKGIGEAGTIGSVPTVANAVGDALRQLGVKHVDIPATPERVWALIQSATDGRANGKP